MRARYLLHIAWNRLRRRYPLSFGQFFATRLHRDLVAEGGLSPVLQRELDRHGGDLVAEWPVPALWSAVERGERSATVVAAARERIFDLSLWDEGIEHLEGWAGDLGQVAAAIADWMRPARPSLDAMSQHHPFLEAKEFARHYAAGNAIEQLWSTLLHGSSLPWLYPMIEAAAARPRLRALRPYTSLGRLCFSRWVGYPFSNDLPYVSVATDFPHLSVPPDVVYRVFRDSPGYHTEEASALAGEFDDPEQAADLLDRLLPDIPVVYQRPPDENLSDVQPGANRSERTQR